MALIGRNGDLDSTKNTNTNGIGAVEDAHNRSVNVRKKIRKIKEGTDGIDAVDEVPEHERFSEGFRLLEGND